MIQNILLQRFNHLDIFNYIIWNYNYVEMKDFFLIKVLQQKFKNKETMFQAINYLLIIYNLTQNRYWMWLYRFRVTDRLGFKLFMNYYKLAFDRSWSYKKIIPINKTKFEIFRKYKSRSILSVRHFWIWCFLICKL